MWKHQIPRMSSLVSSERLQVSVAPCPEQENCTWIVFAAEKKEVDEKVIEKEETNVVRKTLNLSSKVRRRMFTKAMRDFHNLQRRSKETVDHMTFTVDLVISSLHFSSF